jgi:4-oxalocrotonate tautomerase
MPAIIVEATELTKDQKEQLVKEFTASASKIMNLSPEAFFIFIKENKKENVGVAGKLLSDR